MYAIKYKNMEVYLCGDGFFVGACHPGAELFALGQEVCCSCAGKERMCDEEEKKSLS